MPHSSSQACFKAVKAPASGHSSKERKVPRKVNCKCVALDVAHDCFSRALPLHRPESSRHPESSDHTVLQVLQQRNMLAIIFWAPSTRLLLQLPSLPWILPSNLKQSGGFRAQRDNAMLAEQQRRHGCMQLLSKVAEGLCAFVALQQPRQGNSKRWRVLN